MIRPAAANFLADAQAAVRLVRRLLAPELASGLHLQHLLLHCSGGCLTFLKVRAAVPGGPSEWLDFYNDGRRWRSGKPPASIGGAYELFTYRLEGLTVACVVLEAVTPQPNNNAERLHAWLRRCRQWKSRTEVSTRCFGGHLTAAKLSAAVDVLLRTGRIEERRIESGAPVPRREYRAIENQASHGGLSLQADAPVENSQP